MKTGSSQQRYERVDASTTRPISSNGAKDSLAPFDAVAEGGLGEPDATVGLALVVAEAETGTPTVVVVKMEFGVWDETQGGTGRSEVKLVMGRSKEPAIPPIENGREKAS